MSRRHAIIGTGARAMFFAQALTNPETVAAGAELVGLVDINPERMRGFCDILGRDIPQFDSLESLCAKVKPDALVVTTPDHTHAQVIEQAYALGLDVVCEKPMATTREEIGRILRAERNAKRAVRVGFNMRFMPLCRQVKALLNEGVIGPIHSGAAEWSIGREHGMDYFRRWHAHMAQSGGLLVHKATHHFDIINWCMADRPSAVCAMGALTYYGPNGKYQGERCSTCEHREVCDAAMPKSLISASGLPGDTEGTLLQRLYFDAEREDGYIRDRCVYRPDIDIYDTMSVMIRYERGAQMVYSLNAANPIEGFTLSFVGEYGRLEAKMIYQDTMPAGMDELSTIRIYQDPKGEPITIRIEDVSMSKALHSGADWPMMKRLLLGEAIDPSLGQDAGSTEGANSALIGICANESIARGAWVDIPSLDAL